MTAKTYNPLGVWQPFGAFSMVAIQGQGRIAHLKGQVSLDGDSKIVGKGDMSVQVDCALNNIEKVLASLGGQMQDIYALVHHVTDIDAFMKAGAIRARFFSPPYPVTTTVEVSRLYDPELLVEITASAEIPTQRFVSPQTDVA